MNPQLLKQKQDFESCIGKLFRVANEYWLLLAVNYNDSPTPEELAVFNPEDVDYKENIEFITDEILTHPWRLVFLCKERILEERITNYVFLLKWFKEIK
jgi:hypothetical protein